MLDLHVDEDRVLLPAQLVPGDGVLDVRWQGRRVWSLRVDELVHDRGDVELRWPEALRPYARGRGEVAVLVHAADTPLGVAQVRLGDHDGDLQVRDDGGRWLAVNKWGRLSATFEEDGPSTDLLDAAERLIGLLTEVCGLEPFLTYGSLLGAVRQGTTIAHDDDIDLGYLSRHENPSDVLLESFAVERALRQAGIGVRRLSGGHLQLLMPPEGGGEPVHLDVFTSFVIGDHVHQAFAVRMPMSREDVLPLQEVKLDGRRFPAPRRAEAWLEGAYGPGWRVPDPAFRYEVPSAIGRRIYGWLGDVNMHREYWEQHHRAVTSGAEDGSPFARWCLPRLRQDHLLELGCGSGRDALWFASRGRCVLGVDYAEPAVEAARAAAAALDLEARFESHNLYCTSDLMALVRLAAPLAPDVYARLLLNSLDDLGRANVVRLLRGILPSGGCGFLELRDPPGDGPRDAVDDQPGRYPHVDAVVTELEAAGLMVVGREATPASTDGGPALTRMVVTCP